MEVNGSISPKTDTTITSSIMVKPFWTFFKEILFGIILIDNLTFINFHGKTIEFLYHMYFSILIDSHIIWGTSIL